MDIWSRWDLIDYIVRRQTTKELKDLAIKLADKDGSWTKVKI